MQHKQKWNLIIPGSYRKFWRNRNALDLIDDDTKINEYRKVSNKCLILNRPRYDLLITQAPHLVVEPWMTSLLTRESVPFPLETTTHRKLFFIDFYHKRSVSSLQHLEFVRLGELNIFCRNCVRCVTLYPFRPFSIGIPSTRLQLEQLVGDLNSRTDFMEDFWSGQHSGKLKDTISKGKSP